MPNHDILLIDDVYMRNKQAKEKNQEIDFNREAQTLRVLMNAMGREPRMVAITPENEERIEKSFRDAGFTTIVMNGDRPTKLPNVIGREIESMRLHKPKRCILITDDPVFTLLVNQAVWNESEVSMWWSEALPPDFNGIPHDFRRIQDVLPGTEIKVAKVIVYLDYENLHIGLERSGTKPDPKTMIEAVRAKTTDLGKVTEIHAYADWHELSQRSGFDPQRELVMLGVKTHYQINRHGKNTADMEIVHDVQSRVDQPKSSSDAVDVIALGSRDRDFATIVKHAQSRGKRVCILGLREGFSRELRELVPNDIRYLDDHFVQLKPEPIRAATNKPTKTATNEQFTLIMQAAAYMYKRRYPWVYTNKLIDGLALGNEGALQLRQAQATGLLKSGPADKPNTVSLALDHPDTYVAWWLYERLDFYLNKQKKEFVGTPFLKRGMEEDKKMREFKYGQTWSDLNKILDRAVASGCIVRKMRPHPKEPGKRIETWWLATSEQAQTKDSASTPPPQNVEEAQPEESIDSKLKPEAEVQKEKELVNTGGGLYIHGNVTIETGNFIGRDQISNLNMP